MSVITRRVILTMGRRGACEAHEQHCKARLVSDKDVLVSALLRATHSFACCPLWDDIIEGVALLARCNRGRKQRNVAVPPKYTSGIILVPQFQNEDCMITL